MYQGFFVLIYNNFGFLGCSQLIEGISWLFFVPRGTIFKNNIRCKNQVIN